jgi:hypothetical protein
MPVRSRSTHIVTSALTAAGADRLLLVGGPVAAVAERCRLSTNLLLMAGAGAFARLIRVRLASRGAATFSLSGHEWLRGQGR